MFIFKKNKKRQSRTREFDTFKDKWWESSRQKNDVSVLEQLLEVEGHNTAKHRKSKLIEEKPDQYKQAQNQDTSQVQRHNEKEPLDRQYPCEQCGAVQAYSPGTHHLHCEYCGYESLIEESGLKIREYNFKSALRQLQKDHPVYEQPITKCLSLIHI